MASPRPLRTFASVALGLLMLASIAPSAVAVAVAVGPGVTLHVSSAPTTGHEVTITPVVTGFTVSPDDTCRWELRWGTTSALDQTYSGETFGGMVFDVGADIGGCGSWTFTLPWVPYPQFDVRINVVSTGGGFDVNDAVRFTAAVDSTDRHILTSNLPIAQVLPSAYALTVGQPVTYSLSLIGNPDTCCNPHWIAQIGPQPDPATWTQSGGSTFTFIPTVSGDLFVEWHRESAAGILDAYYDPPVRPPDKTRPTTTAPNQRIRTMAAGDTIPIAISWTGADQGTGVKSYQLQRSVNGGAWSYVHLPSPSLTSIGVTGAPGTTLRFRVRAIDMAGNYGYWTYGPTFAVQRLPDTSSASRYTTGAWAVKTNAAALGGALHVTSKTGAATSITFTGRDVAWIAEKGPGHGFAKVYVDGAYIGSIDLGATTTQPRVIVFGRHFSSVGTHVLRIVNLAMATRPLIDVDGIAVLR